MPDGIEVDSEMQWIIDKIVNKRTKQIHSICKQVEYLVQWEGYNSSWNTWEPEWQLHEDRQLSEIEAFKASRFLKEIKRAINAKNSNIAIIIDAGFSIQ